MKISTNPEQSRGCNLLKTSPGRRIGHVNLWVADLIRATSFYCDVLGLSVNCDGTSIGLPTVFLTFGDYHHHIALNWFYREGDDSKLPRRGGLNHLAILHCDEVSLARAVSRVVDHDVSIDSAQDHGGTLSIYLRDPDGNGIELYYDRPRTQWFDSTGQFVIKSEPFDVRKWLADIRTRSVEGVRNQNCIHPVEVAV